MSDSPSSNPMVRYQLHEMDHAVRMFPVGTVSTTPAIMCRPYGEVYVLASDHESEIERLRAALVKLAKIHPHGGIHAANCAGCLAIEFLEAAPAVETKAATTSGE